MCLLTYYATWHTMTSEWLSGNHERSWAGGDWYSPPARWQRLKRSHRHDDSRPGPRPGQLRPRDLARLDRHRPLGTRPRGGPDRPLHDRGRRLVGGADPRRRPRP